MEPALTVILVLAIVIAAVYLVFWIVRKTRSKPAPKAAVAPTDPFAPSHDAAGDPRSLKAGDMIEFGTQRYFVRGSLRLAEGGATWSEHFFQGDDDAASRQWLTVEEDPDVQLAVYRDRPDLELLPNAQQLVVDDVTYSLTERGTASYRSEASTGLRPTGGVDYADYEAADGQHYLAFERFDHGRWEVSLGKKILPGSFTIYPASQ